MNNQNRVEYREHHTMSVSPGKALFKKNTVSWESRGTLQGWWSQSQFRSLGLREITGVWLGITAGAVLFRKRGILHFVENH